MSLGLPAGLGIKNMVCGRCILAVEGILEDLSIAYHAIEIGEIFLCQSLDDVEKKKINERLKVIGLEVFDKRLHQLIEKAKQLITLKARNESLDDNQSLNLSIFLCRRLAIEYKYLSSLFSSVEGEQ